MDGKVSVPTYDRLELAEASARPFRIALTPFPTLLLTAGGALSPDDECFGGVPAEWRASIRSALRREDLRTMAPLLAPDAEWPDCIVPSPANGESSLDDELDRLADMPGDVLLGELAGHGVEASREWRAVARDPRSWLHAYVGVLRRAAPVFERHWADAAPLLDRELERIGAATVRGALPELLGGLLPRARVSNGELCFPAPRPGRLRIPEAGLVIAPTIAGPAGIGHWGDGMCSYIAYPMPGIGRLLDRDHAVPAQLESLLGRSRALLLRMLDRPATAGELAKALIAVPSAVTHHLRALEAAGLVERERHGRHVLVRRTGRGTTLLDLYER